MLTSLVSDRGGPVAERKPLGRPEGLGGLHTWGKHQRDVGGVTPGIP